MVDSTHRVHTLLTANSTGLVSSLRKSTTAFYAAGGAASRLGTIGRAAFHPMTAAIAATAISVRALSRVMMEAVKVTVGFNDTMARTNAILGGSTKDFNTLEKEVRSVAAATRFTASEVAQAANTLAIAGVTIDEMVGDEALDALVKFAIVGGVDIQTATNIAIAGVKAFGMEMDQLGHVSDVLTRTMTRSNVTMVSLGEGMKFAAPVANAAGINIQETAAAIGALGNAGLRGTVAGTGLRMSINKLLKPTHDSMRAMRDLGLNVTTLSAAGHAAKAALDVTTMQLDRAKASTERLSTEMRMLNRQMSDLSIEQQANSLAIEQIRARAARNNRDLTRQEIETIERLTKHNDSLRLSEMELDLQRARTAHELDGVRESQRELTKSSNDLLRTVEQQTTGVTSLGDVLDQLAAASATTTQVLEIFGVRGGTAMASLLAQRESFHDLVEMNHDAAGATAEYTSSLQQTVDQAGSAREAFFLFFSKIQEGLINVGMPLIAMLAQLADQFGPVLQDALTENADLFAKLGKDIAFAAVIIAKMAISLIPDIIRVMRVLVPVVLVVAAVFKGIMVVLGSFAQLIIGITNLVIGLVKVLLAAVQLLGKLVGLRSKGGGDMFRSGLGDLKSGGRDTLIGGAKSAVIVGTGGVAGFAGGAAMGGAAGAATIGGLGFSTTAAGVGGVGIASLMANGGFVNGATPAIIGEAGPEVVIPLSPGKAGRRDQLAAQAGLGGMSVNVGDIVINGASDPSTTATMVRQVVERDLPAAIRRELTRGARGVI